MSLGTPGGRNRWMTGNDAAGYSGTLSGTGEGMISGGRIEKAEVDANVVVMVGRWILYMTGDWDFKIDKSRMGRCINCRDIDGPESLRKEIGAKFGVNPNVVNIELTYWKDDFVPPVDGKRAAPIEIVSNRCYRIFRYLHKHDKSFNIFVTLRELRGEELVILGRKQGTEPDMVSNVRNGGRQEGRTEDDSVGGGSRSENAEGEDGWREAIVADAEAVDAAAALAGTRAVAPVVERVVEQLGAAVVNPGIAHISADDDGDDGDDDADDDDNGVDDGNGSDWDAEDGDGDTDDDRNDGKNDQTGEATDEEGNEGYDSDYDMNWWDDYVRADGKEDYDGDKRSNGEGSSGVENLVENLFLETPPKKDTNPRAGDARHDDDSDGFVQTGPIWKSSSSVGGGRSANGGRELMCGIRIVDMYGFADVEPMFDDGDFDEDIDLSNEDTALYVGRVFRTKESFKITLHINALQNVFRFRFHRHAKYYVDARCIDTKCDWRVVANEMGQSGSYEVRKAYLTHSCEGDIRREYKKHGTAKVIAALLRSKYENAFGGPRARDLPDMIRVDHKFIPSYWKCWKARELAIATARGTDDSSFNLLPLYFHVLKHANPGSICHLETDVDGNGKKRFRFAFMALKASIDGWRHLRKVVVVDGTHLFGKYKGCLLTACGQDANYQIFPIAFAVVDSENDESWIWFFEKLLQIIEDDSDLTIVSDRCQSIYTAKEACYPRAHHGACLVHLQRNVQAKFRKKGQKKLVGQAGSAYKVSHFRNIYERIKRTDYKCWEYLEGIDPQHWTRSHSAGMRYNLLSSNIAESLNNALLPARDSPIVALFEFIRRMLSRWFESRRVKISKMRGDIPPEVDKVLIKQLKLGRGLGVLPLSPLEFEVTSLSGLGRHHVSLDSKTCTCRRFQLLKLPCRHAIAAATHRGLAYEPFVDDIHKKSVWELTISGLILPVPDPDDIDVPPGVKDCFILPPMKKRPPGRPANKRKASAGEFPLPEKKKPGQNKCSKCGILGHKRTTCEAVAR